MNNDINQNSQPTVQTQPQYQPPMQPDQPGKKLAIASLVMGILSIAFSWLGLAAVICVGLGIAAVICGLKAKKKGFIGNVSTAGIVLGIVGIVISAVVFIICTVAVCATAGALGNLDPDILNQIEGIYY